MTPSERADQINQWTLDSMMAVAREAIGDRPRDEIPKWLAPRVAAVIKAGGGQPEDVARVLDEILGLGPLEPLLRDKTNTEIRIGGPDAIEVLRAGNTEAASVAFSDERHLQSVFGRIFRAMKVDPTAGPVETTMMDGSKLTAQLTDGKLSATIVRPG